MISIIRWADALGLGGLSLDNDAAVAGAPLFPIYGIAGYHSWPVFMVSGHLRPAVLVQSGSREVDLLPCVASELVAGIHT